MIFYNGRDRFYDLDYVYQYFTFSIDKILIGKKNV